jgi:membrane peptidoglycan carboxypeptidase
LKKAGILVASSFALFLLALVGAYYYLSSSISVPTELAAGIQYQNSTVYYSDGTTPIGTFSTENRQDLEYSQIPMHLQDAALAAEDRSYWSEGAISPTGILRAAWDDLTSSGGNQSGGSTITQQFVRQYYSDTAIGTQQTASRKIKEIFVAMKVTNEYNKQWILQHYLNAIYLGENSYGVAAAAQTYFGEPVGQLTIAQDAVIAAIIQQPTNYPQKMYRSDLIGRWHYVLNGMVKMGDITQAQADSMKFPVLLTDSPAFALQQQSGVANPNDPWAPYVMNVVENELTHPASEGGDGYTQDQLDTGGFKIVTTINRQDEIELYNAVNTNVALMAQNGGALPSYARIGGEVQDPQNGAILAIYPGPGYTSNQAKCAMEDCQLNMAVYARAQVGSSFKPYVLSEAVIEGMNAQTSVLNANSPLWVPPDTTQADQMMLSATNKAQAVPQSYEVNNDDYKGHGGLNAQAALAISSNTAYSDLAHRVGTQNIINLAGQMGVDAQDYLQPYKGEVGLALGIGSLTVNEQDTMLATIANGGVYHAAHLIATITAPSGTRVNGKYAVHTVMTPDQDSQVQWAMSTVVTNGTAAGMVNMAGSRPIIAKTGTTTSNRSVYFIGAVRQYAVTIAIFTKDQADCLDKVQPAAGQLCHTTNPETLKGLGGLSAGGFGGYWPAKIWNTYSQLSWSKLPVQSFLQPVFSGSKWNQVPAAPPKPKPSATPTPTKTCKNPLFCQGNGHGRGPGGFPTTPITGTATTPVQTCVPPLCTTTPTSTATAGAPTGFPTLGAPTAGTASTAVATRASPAVTQSGFAVGGLLSVVPGSLLWARASRRRRRRKTHESAPPAG